MKYAVAFLVIIFFNFSSAPREKWTYLFNNKDLKNWDTWLAIPHSSWEVKDNPRDSSGNYTKPIGLNQDPFHVFTVSNIDGAAAIHISGQGFGALTTKDEYENFHLSVDYKWGEKKWPPRDKQKRDSGILYYCVGEHGAGGGSWMQSQECQVQEGDTGDYWSVGGAIADVKCLPTTTTDCVDCVIYSPNGTMKIIGKDFDGKTWNTLRCLKSATNEKPLGSWNHVDVYAYQGRSVHVVNGTTVMVIENSRHTVDGKDVPLTKGKIQLQTEGAEIYYRDVKIRKISAIPQLDK
jgi:hypothetical protein